ncbi:MAG: SRPBCC family protein [Dehalococcoidia bacterium]
MFTNEETIHIDAPPEEVFRYVTDIKRHPEWCSNPMEMTVHGEPVAVGTTFTSVVNAFGKETGQGKVIEMDSPRRFVYEVATTTSGTWRWTMTLTPEAGGTRLAHRGEGLKVPGWFKVMQPLTFPFVGRKMATKGLAKLKERVEAGAAKEAAAG